MRTIEAPGVEWKEYDLSQVAPAMAGTVALVMGFAAKGEDEKPTYITGASTWKTVFGEPKTEAELYFYKACMKVLDENSSLLCAKIPYTNGSQGVFRGVRYVVDYAKNTPDKFKTISNTYDKTNVSGIVPGFSNETIDGYDPIELLAVDIVRSEKIDGYSQNVNQIVNISQAGNNIEIAENDLNIYRIGQLPEEITKTPTGDDYDQLQGNDFIIVDISKETFGKDTLDREDVGIFPVVVAAGNAMAYQNALQEGFKASYSKSHTGVYAGNEKNITLSGFQFFSPCVTIQRSYDLGLGADGLSGDVVLGTTKYNVLSATEADFTDNSITGANYDPNAAILISSPSEKDITVASMCINNFPTLLTTEDGSIDKENLTKLTVCVVKAYVDKLNGNKINFKILESYTGSPWKNDVDADGSTIYLGDIINGTSNYIEFYSELEHSNVSNGNTSGDVKKNINDIYVSNFGVPYTTTGNYKIIKTGLLTGFTAEESRKYIHSAQIIQSLQSIFDKVQNINALNIDIVCDAGISNIAQFVTSNGSTAITVKGDPKTNIREYKPQQIKFKLQKRDDTLAWRSIYAIYNTFCSTTRKDCAFIFDGLRPVCLDGSKKIIRDTKPSNTVDVDIIPKLNYMAGLNTSYGAGYINWDMVVDDFTGNFFFRPPSIAAMGAWLYTDRTANYWNAPAGLNRGIVSDSLDIAFNPNPKQAGTIYTKGWNYMVNWPTDGITIEGQKTLQAKPSAFDRISVRRLFLRLERATYQTCRYFVYEKNTPYTRQRLLDAITPMYENAKQGGGLYDYKIVCSDKNNPADVIDRNELVVDIALKPTRDAEFIMLNFYALSTGADWSVAGM